MAVITRLNPTYWPQQDGTATNRDMAYHFQKAKHQLTDNHKAFGFLQTHLLSWLEAMSIMGSMDQVLRDIDSLQATIDVSFPFFLPPSLSTNLNFRQLQATWRPLF